MTLSLLENILRRFDDSLDPLAETDIAEAIRAEIRGIESTNDSDRQVLIAEQFAFSVMPNYRHEETSWGTYYGPMMTGRWDDGTYYEWPSIREVDKANVDHWIHRYGATKNPVLVARYADLVWDLSKLVCGVAPTVYAARTAIDALCDAIAESKYRRNTEAIERIHRALNIAVSINDQLRVVKVRNLMIELEDRIAVDEKGGLWGFCFDSLVENKHVELEPDQEAKIIWDLEQRFARLSNPSDPLALDPHGAETAAMRLVTYYQRKNARGKVESTLKQYSDAYVAKAKVVAPLVAHAWLKQVYEYLQQSGFPEHAVTLEKDLQNYGMQAAKEMKPISASTSIPKGRIDRYLEEMTTGSTEEVLTRIALHFIPDPKKTEDELLRVAKIAPLQALISRTVVDSEGRPIVTVGSIEDDLSGRVALQIGQEMEMEAPFLRMTLERFRDEGRLTPPVVMEFLNLSPLFKEDRKELVEQGIRALFFGDHATAAHLLIPQIEGALRELLSLTGGQIYRPGKQGDLRLRLLDDILRDSTIEHALGGRITTFFRLLLTDPRGWNLRNNSMHGLLAYKSYSPLVSDRLLQALCVLGLIRQEAKKEDTQNTQTTA